MLNAEFLAASANALNACVTVRLFASITGVDSETARWWVRYSPECAELRARHAAMRPAPAVDPVAYIAARCAPKSSERGCWEWAGSFTAGGVPQLKVGGADATPRPARRWLYEALNPGPQPKGMRIISSCTNEACVAPHHMQRMSPSQFSRWLHREHITDCRKREGARKAARARSTTLPDAVVDEIRRLARDEGLNGLQISQRLGIKHSTVCGVISGRSHGASTGLAGAATVADARRAAPLDVVALAAQASVFRMGTCGLVGLP